MRIAIVQSSLFWENPSENIQKFTELTEKVDADIIVLPEMFATGFTMKSHLLAQKMDGETVTWMKNTAKRKNAVIIGSLIVEENNKYFNRLVWAQPDGITHCYDKRHLFRMADENNYYSEGTKRIVIDYKGFRFCPLVCYDLRFPVWSRNMDDQGNAPVFDCLLYVANWPEARSSAWTSLLKARAIENQVYSIGVNRVGLDGKDISYSGDSRIYSPKGERLDKFEPGKEMIEIIDLDLDELRAFRENFPVSMDADRFKILD